jgi:hypothetical protein
MFRARTGVVLGRLRFRPEQDPPRRHKVTERNSKDRKTLRFFTDLKVFSVKVLVCITALLHRPRAVVVFPVRLF